MAIRAQPAYNSPRRINPLWTACIFAHRPGWTAGARITDVDLASREDSKFRSNCNIRNSIDVTSWAITPNMGRDLRNVASLDSFDYGNQGDRYHPRFGVMSIACLVRPLIIPAAATASGILDKSTSPASTTQNEYSIGINGSASTWRVYITPVAGATNVVNSTTTLSLARTDMIIATYTDNNMRIYVNGIKEADIIPANTGIKNISSIVLAWFQMKGGTGSVLSSAAVGMGAVWERELSISEVMALSTDPYVMWRGRQRILGQAAAAPPAPGVVDNSCCLCNLEAMTGPLAPQQIIY